MLSIRQLIQVENRLMDSFWEKIFTLLIVIFLLIFLIFGIGMVVKIIYTKKKYGFKHFQKKEPKQDHVTFLSYFVQHLRGYSKTVFLSANSLLMINEYGLYIFFVYDEKGYIVGSSKDPFLYRQNDQMPLFNPFSYLDETKQKLENELKESIQVVIILKDLCNFAVTDYKDEIILKEKNVISKLGQKMNHPKVYNREQIEELYKKVMSINVK